MIKILYLVIGSILGGLARYFMASAIYEVFGTAFPLGILAVNVVGCFLVGLFSAWGGGKFLLDPNSRLLLITGFCGAFTTFSALMLDTGNFVKDGEMTRAFLNVALSLVIGFIAFKLGILLGKII